MKMIGYAAHTAAAPLAPFSFERRDLRADDVAVEVLYCGVCHTDLHFARNDWGVSTYPLVPGHEIVGRVTAIGSAVTRHVVGDVVAIGTMVDSCGACDQCHHDAEQFCRAGATYTYASKDRLTGEITQGGYAKQVVVRDAFALKVPAGLDPARTGPLLCAGVTTYSPLRDYGVGPGSRVAVVGIGGVGHLAVKLAAALGAEVTAITRSADKAAEARGLGADRVVVSSSEDAMRAAASSFDVIVDCVPVVHDVSPYVGLLDIGGTLAIVGAFGKMPAFDSWSLLGGNRRIAGSGAGGLARTQELLDFCAKKSVLPECEILPIQKVNEAFERLERGDVRYRFVADLASLG